MGQALSHGHLSADSLSLPAGQNCPSYVPSPQGRWQLTLSTSSSSSCQQCLTRGGTCPGVGPQWPPGERPPLAEARAPLCALSYFPTSNWKITSDMPWESLLTDLIQGSIKPSVAGPDTAMPFLEYTKILYSFLVRPEKRRGKKSHLNHYIFLCVLLFVFLNN